MAYINEKEILFSPKVIITEGGDTEAAFNAGKEAERKAVWDAIQDYGRRTNYNNAFTGYGLMGDIFYPTYDLKPTQANSMYYMMGDTCATGGRNTRIDFAQRFIDCGIEFSLSNCTRAQDIFFYCKVATRLPKLDLTKIEAEIYARRLVYQCSNLTKIDEIVVPPTLTPQNWFDYCTELTDLTISGTIGQNGFNVHWSTKLSKASLLSILGACNIDVTASPVTITLPSKCIDGVTDTKDLLENLDNTAISYLIEDTAEMTTIQLADTNIIAGSVELYPYNKSGTQNDAKRYDDGQGNIYAENFPDMVSGTINYETGEIVLYNSIGLSEDLLVSYETENSPYTKALALGYNIAFA